MYKELFSKLEDPKKQNAYDLKQYQSISEQTYNFVIQNFS